MIIKTWSEVLVASFQNLWTGVLGFVPNLLVAVLIIIIGWIIGALIGRIVNQLIKSVKLDEALKKAGVEDVLKKGGVPLNSGVFLGALVKWFVIVVFLVAAFDVLGLTRVNDFLQGVVLGYIPNLIVAVLILLVAGVLGDVLAKIVIASAKTAGIHSANLLGKLSKWAIWIFAILVALTQIGIAAGFIQTLFTGFVVALSIALGLSFGLGGQEAAGQIVNKIRNEIAHRE